MSLDNDPPRIRDDRRDPDLTRLKERLAVVEDTQDKQERLITGMHYAMFGVPEDRTNNGLVGAMADMKSTLRTILVSVLAGVGIDVVLRVVLS